MKRLLLPALLAPLAIGCGSDDKTEDKAPTYLLNIPIRNWTEPEDFGEDIGVFVQQFVIRDDGDTATVGLAHDGVQDTCSKTATIPKNGNNMGPADYEVYLPASENAMLEYENVAVVATIKKFTLTNVLPSGGTPSENGEDLPDVDRVNVWPLFYKILATSENSVCGTIEMNGGSCEDCSDGEPYCLTMVAEGLGATAFSGEFQDVPESCPEMLIPEDS